MLKSRLMKKHVQKLIQSIHDAPPRIVLVTAGGGTQTLSALLSVAGASRTLLEAIVPYSEAAFNEFLGQSPAKYVAPETARLLAGRAYTRARWLDTEAHPVIGLACTATIVTDRPKRGEHRAFIATWQPKQMVTYGLYLEKGERDRTEEESLVSLLLFRALAQAFSLPAPITLSLTAKDRLTVRQYDFAQWATQLEQQEVDYFGISADGRVRHDPPTLILSGAFNPLHTGHLGLAQAAQTMLKRPVAFECAAANVDKPPLDSDTLLNRMAQFAGRWPVYASNAATYLEKARIYPNTTFIVGYDTTVRILQPRYYQNSIEKRNEALKQIAAQNCTFVVAGRKQADGIFYNFSNLAIPPHFQHLFAELPAAHFRSDISSTEIRAQGLRGSR